jgi:hypothetical protein
VRDAKHSLKAVILFDGIIRHNIQKETELQILLSGINERNKILHKIFSPQMVTEIVNEVMHYKFFLYNSNEIRVPQSTNPNVKVSFQSTLRMNYIFLHNLHSCTSGTHI